MSLYVMVDGKPVLIPLAVEATGPEAVGAYLAKHAPKKAHKNPAPPEPAPEPEA